MSDVARSTRFYREIVGCRHLSTVPRGDIAFLDAAGTCLILVKRNPPINPLPDNHGGAHHSFAVEHDEYKAAFDHLRAHGVEITFEEDRQGGVLNGPCAHFHDPDRTVLEFIDLDELRRQPIVRIAWYHEPRTFCFTSPKGVYSDGFRSGIAAPQASSSSRKADCQFRATIS